jgi:diacylglycerol kinase family enzyme
VLAEQILDLCNAGARPVLDPALGQVILDVMESTLVHLVKSSAKKWRRAMGRAAHLEHTRGLLIVNPRSGNGKPDARELEREAARRGINVHVLAPGDDAQAIARTASGPIGAAGGDGSLGPVAEVALERDVPFVCVPFGTRNHFARDIGLDRSDPIAALAAFDSGGQVRIDVGRVGARVFLNNVSFGL